jgi:chromatin modification-related protein YNG2
MTDLLQDISRDQARYVKSALKNVSSSSFRTLGLNGQKSVSPTPTPSKIHLPGRIASAYAEIAVLNDEKIALAQSLINLLNLTKARLDVDLVKVKTLQGGPIEDSRAPSSSQSTQVRPSVSMDKRSDAISGISAVAHINQSLRNATMNMQPSTSGPGYTKSELFQPFFQHRSNI